MVDPIYGTITAGDSGPKVANLQLALRTLLQRGLLLAAGTPQGGTAIDSGLLIKALDREIASSTYGAVTRQLVRIWQAEHGLDGAATGNVDVNTAKSLNDQLASLGALSQPPAADQPPSSYVVHGRVAGGKRGMIVTAYDVDFRSEQALGEATLADDEKYIIKYDAARFARAEQGTADLRVAVSESGGRELVSSAITFNAGAHTTIDLSVDPTAPPRAEYEQHADALTPILQGLTLGEVARGSDAQQKRDIDFLAGDSGIDSAHVAWLIRAAAFEQRGRTIANQKRDVPNGGRLPAEVFYGWFREGIPDSWDQLVSQPLARLRSTLLAAIDHRVISEAMRVYADQIAAQIPNAERDALQTVGARAGLPPERLTTVLQSAASLDDVTNTLVADLVAREELQPTEARALGLGVTIHRLVDANDAVASALQSLTLPQLGDSSIRRPRDLAALRPADVRQVLEKAAYQPADGESLDDAANRIVDRVAQMFPNDVLMHRVFAGDARLGDDDSGKQRVVALQKLQAQNPDLDLLAVDYLPDSDTVGSVQFGTLDEKTRTRAISDLKALQRARALGKDPGTAVALAQARLTASRAITRLTFDDFMKASGLSEQAATATYAIARKKVNEAAIAYFGFHDLARNGSKQHRYLFGPPPNLIELPGYADIFGNITTCTCDHCKSVLSPAAYFVDLMWYVDRNILNPTFKNHGGETNAMHLRSRRPDLWTLPLTCSNAERIVPYLDIVIRILESYIVDQVPGVTAASLYSMLAIQDGSIRQPFALPLEKLAILLEHFELTRYDIAKRFVLGNASADQQLRVRCRLGLTPLEYGIITGTRLGSPPTTTTLGVARTYYESQLIVATNLSTIPTDVETRFIDSIDSHQLAERLGVEREVLLLLVATRFIHASDNTAARRVTIKRGISTGGTSVQNDTEVVTQLTFGRLDRLERFTRLWRRTPWNVVELDYVISRLQATIPPAATPAPEGRLDTSILAALVSLFELQDELTIPVDVLCALWDQLPTERLRDTTPLFDRVFNQPNFIKASTDRWPSNSTFTFPELPTAAASNVQARLLASLQLSDAQLADLFTGLGITGVAYQLTASNLGDLYRHATLAKLLRLTISELFATIALTLTTPRIASLADLLAVLETHRWRTESDFRLDQIQYIAGSLTSLPELGSPATIVSTLLTDVKAEDALEFADTVFTAIGLTEAESRVVTADNISVTATDGLALEQVPNATSYRLSPTWDPGNSGAPFVFTPQASTAIVATTARVAYDIALAAGAAGFADTAFVPLGMTATESAAFVAANTAATSPAFQAVGGGATTYELFPGMKAADVVNALVATSSAALQIVATRQLRAKARALLVRHHPMEIVTTKLAAALATTAERVRSLIALIEPPVGADTPPRSVSIAIALQGGPVVVLEDLVAKVARLSVLVKNPVFDRDAIAFIGSKPSVFGLSLPLAHATDTLAIGVDTVRRIALYVAAAQPADPAYGDESTDNSSALRTLLSATTGWQNASPSVVAATLRIDTAQAKALLDALAPKLGSNIDGVDQLRRAAALAKSLGAAATTLKLAVSDNLVDLTSAVDGVRGLFRSHYADDATFAAKVEPYDDRIRSRQRDGLVEYLINPPINVAGMPGRFATPDDMYEVFLIDVSQEGCARTSELVSAISSVQLYVYRVIMRLEQGGSPVPSVELPLEPRAEWSWRQNYRVWEANRKVFLFPENYVEPGLRDDKTPLFKELEEALLQKQLTDQSVLDAYANYLHGLDELARLEIAGAYHDTNSDVLHLFGVTPTDPPIHYYRAVQNLSASDPLAVHYAPWLKIDLQIPVRRVSPILFRGRLFVFWIEISTRPISEFANGTTRFTKYRHTVRTRFSQLRLDGKWTAPQTLKVEDDSQARSDVRIVDDPVSPRSVKVMDHADNSIVYGVLDITDSDWPTKLLKLLADNNNPTVDYELLLPAAEFDIRNRDHTEPIENYAPEGPKWERTYPAVLGQGDSASLVTMFVPRSDGQSAASREAVDLWSGDATPNGDTTPTPLLSATTSAAQQGFTLTGLTLPTQFDAQIVGGNTQSRIYHAAGQVLFAQSTASNYRMWRLSSSLISRIGEEIAVGKLESMLSTAFQINKLNEASSPFGFGSIPAPGVPTKPFETGKSHTLAQYIRELFFHIPFLLADFANSRQKFETALQWYSYLFDPTATDASSGTGGVWRYAEFRQLAGQATFKDVSGQFTNADQLRAYASDPFNPHAIARLRASAYSKAIFMRYVDTLLDWGDSLFTEFTMESVNEATMLYVMASEILGPRPESVGPCGIDQATPATYATIAPTLTTAQPDDFLIEEVELFSITAQIRQENDGAYVALPPAPQYANRMHALLAAPMALGGNGNGHGSYGDGVPPYGASNPVGWNTAGNTIWSSAGGTSLAQVYAGATALGGAGGGGGFTVLGTSSPTLPLGGDPIGPPDTPLGGGFPIGGAGGVSVGGLLPDKHVEQLDIKYTGRDIPTREIPQQNPPSFKPADLLDSKLIFCIPENDELMAYWDRVENRLYNIRNCMDISGVRRLPSLFQPPIDPHMLVRLRAAGLSLDDVLNATSGDLPPYRFAYLIEKAKQHASTVQSFGSQLQSAMEKRDAEELQRLRTIHEQNLLSIRSKTMDLEVQAAQDTLESLQRQQLATEYRRDHFAQLLAAGLSGSETVQENNQSLSAAFNTAGSLYQGVAAIAHLVAQVGAPTSMKYGGAEVGAALQNLGAVYSALGSVADIQSRAAAGRATFERRAEEWKHQVDTANKELDVLAKQITAAQFRRDIASEAKEIHQRSIEQAEEVFDLMRDRFTNFGRFVWLSTEMQKLNRLGFNDALATARLAERAYRFERPETGAETLIGDSYWDATNGGLLAGDRLLIDLQQLERRFIETNYRTLEVEQSFALSQLAPSQLLKLREQGSCTFSIPEMAFALTYPGHYQRRIKSVRLSIPCVTGPYLNIGATLELTGSRIRQNPRLADALVDVPLRHSTTIAASSAQNDAGVFEFSFRDERYMPFEGAGAISDWKLTLPKSFRVFDYRTISDVIMRIDYTAEDDADLRTAVESTTSSTAGALHTILKNTGVPIALSLRHDFPDAWRMLVSSAANTTVAIDITERQLPAFIAGWLHGDAASPTVSWTATGLAFVTQGAVASQKPTAAVSVGAGTGALVPTQIGGTRGASGLYEASLSLTSALSAATPKATLRLSVTDAGNAAPDASAHSTALIDEGKLRDIVVLATAKIGP